MLFFSCLTISSENLYNNVNYQYRLVFFTKMLTLDRILFLFIIKMSCFHFFLSNKICISIILTSHSRKNNGPFLVTFEKLLAKFWIVKIFEGGSYRSIVKALSWGGAYSKVNYPSCRSSLWCHFIGCFYFCWVYNLIKIYMVVFLKFIWVVVFIIFICSVCWHLKKICF